MINIVRELTVVKFVQPGLCTLRPFDILLVFISFNIFIISCIVQIWWLQLNKQIHFYLYTDKTVIYQFDVCGITYFLFSYFYEVILHWLFRFLCVTLSNSFNFKVTTTIWKQDTNSSESPFKPTGGQYSILTILSVTSIQQKVGYVI